jgi:hypothetical protein
VTATSSIWHARKLLEHQIPLQNLMVRGSYTECTKGGESFHLRHLNVVLLIVYGYISVWRERKYSRSSIMLVRMRVLTVPRGCPSSAAISVWLKPE